MSEGTSEGNRKRNLVVHRQARQVIWNLIEKCDQESRQNSVCFPLKQATKRAADYCGKSEYLIKRIRKEGKQLQKQSGGTVVFSTPGKKRNTRKDNRKLFVDEFDKCVIRHVVQKFYKTEKVVPTAKKLLPIVKQRIHFPWGTKSLIRVLKTIGFKWRKCGSKRKILIEKPEIVQWRHQYLVNINALRESGRNLIYLDETCLDSNISVKKRSEEVLGVAESCNASHQLILLHAGGKKGFVSEAKLLFCKAESTSGDHHGQMNHQNFEKWLTEMLIPHIPTSSVIILDNAPYHSVVSEKYPTKYSTKKEMVNFLQKCGVNCNEEMRKGDLLPLLEAHRPRKKEFRIDNVLTSLGHTPVRLPPHTCDLNPIESAWAKIKDHVRSHSIDGNLSLQKLQVLTEEAIEAVTEADWVGFCKKVEETEAEYWENDGIVSDVIDSIIDNMASDDDISTSDNDSDSSEHIFSDSDEELNSLCNVAVVVKEENDPTEWSD